MFSGNCLEVYGIDYTDLLDTSGGHRVPHREAPQAQAMLGGSDCGALEDLDDAEQKQLLQYLAFLKSQRAQRD